MVAHIDPYFAPFDEPSRRLIERRLVTISRPSGLSVVQGRLVKAFGEVLLGISDLDPFYGELLPPMSWSPCLRIHPTPSASGWLS